MDDVTKCDMTDKSHISDYIGNPYEIENISQTFVLDMTECSKHFSWNFIQQYFPIKVKKKRNKIEVNLFFRVKKKIEVQNNRSKKNVTFSN